jgi:hypothetical protein
MTAISGKMLGETCVSPPYRGDMAQVRLAAVLSGIEAGKKVKTEDKWDTGGDGGWPMGDGGWLVAAVHFDSVGGLLAFVRFDSLYCSTRCFACGAVPE